MKVKRRREKQGKYSLPLFESSEFVLLFLDDLCVLPFLSTYKAVNESVLLLGLGTFRKFHYSSGKNLREFRKRRKDPYGLKGVLIPKLYVLFELK